MTALSWVSRSLPVKVSGNYAQGCTDAAFYIPQPGHSFVSGTQALANMLFYTFAHTLDALLQAVSPRFTAIIQAIQHLPAAAGQAHPAKDWGRKFLIFVLPAFLSFSASGCRQTSGPIPKGSLTDDRQIVAVQREHLNKTEVTGKVRVYKLLREDDEGLRHEQFLVLLSNGTTVKVAHSIDIAPPVPVEPGNDITLHGEYIWNEKGGVIHWTHHSDSPKHEGGWIEFNGKRYE